MENILKEPIASYLQESKKELKGNLLAHKLRKEFPDLILENIPDKIRYKVAGSPGQGNWAEIPWIAIFDTLITESAQTGYYPVFLYVADMSGVFLSLNQGVIDVEKDYKRNAKDILKVRAEDFKAKLELHELDLQIIDLKSSNKNAKLYEAGNIIARYYPANNLPNSNLLRADLIYMLNQYQELTFNDQQITDKDGITAVEKKKYRLHFRIERNTAIVKKVKKLKGYKCEACEFKFTEKYGKIGENFIEAHHLTPISSLEIGSFKINLNDDFAVLCSNCHSMIHKLYDPSDLDELKRIVKTAGNSNQARLL